LAIVLFLKSVVALLKPKTADPYDAAVPVIAFPEIIELFGASH